MNLDKFVTDVPDFPIAGIVFKDITPLLANGEAYHYAIDQLARFAKEKNADIIIGPEARGFIFGCPVAYNLSLPFVPVRKPKKLPRKSVKVSYDLEYGKNTLCLHADSIKKGQNVLIIDDLLATGGTIKATIDLVKELGGNVVGLGFLIEIEMLKGRNTLEGYDVFSILKY